MIDNRNMILAVVLSMAILLGFEFFFKSTAPVPPPEAQSQAQKLAPIKSPMGAQISGGAPSLPRAPGSNDIPSVAAPSVPSGANPAGVSRAKILAHNNRIPINTSRLHGSIALTGGRIDDLTLIDYREDLGRNSPEIVLLSPKGAAGPYYAQFGWVAPTGVTIPGANTVWQARGNSLTPDTPVVLTWDNGSGLIFNRTYAIDENYMFTITQNVRNTGAGSVNLNPYGLISRGGTPETTDFYILHEGLLGVFDGVLSEVDYEDARTAGVIKKPSTGGWMGFTDKYWLAALVPDQKSSIEARFLHRKQGTVDAYQVDYIGPQATVASGATLETTNRFFAGAKEVLLLDAYEEKFGIGKFDLAIDFGWFYFLTKPIFYALLWIHGHVLNLGISILLLTVSIKLLFFPLANKSYTSMSKMKKLQPEITTLRERYAEDKTRLNQEMMALYKKEKVNPAAGCLPILIQIPVFFALYKVLFVTIEMRHAPFFGWIHDLSAPDPTTLFNLFGLIPWTPPEIIPMIGVWPVIMGLTMFLQQKLNPQPADPIQAKIFLFLPLFFTFLLAGFPAGLVIYWAWNNSLSILQQWIIMRRMGITGKAALK